MFVYELSGCGFESSCSHIKEDDYDWALGISTDFEYYIYLRKYIRSCFVNDYNAVLLKPWQANTDFQPEKCYYKAFAYMAAYFSKSEQETSEALCQAEKEIKNKKIKPRESIQKITQAFASAHHVLVQEVTYLCLPEL